MLMGIEVPENQGNTIFSSGFNAYKKFQSHIKVKIRERKGIFLLLVLSQKLVELEEVLELNLPK